MYFRTIQPFAGYTNGVFIVLFENVLFWFTRLLVSTYMRVMLKFNVEAGDPLPEGAKIIAANHPSNADAFYVAGMIPKRSYILITNEAFKVFGAGAWLRKLGHIPVIAGQGQQAVDRGVELLRRGETVVIFPEGGKSPFGGFMDPRTGAARLALTSGAPVIPLGIHIQYRSKTIGGVKQPSREKHGGWFLRGPYYLTYGKPVTYTGNVEDRRRVRKVSRGIMDSIIELAHTSKLRMGKSLPLFPLQGVKNPSL